MPNIPPSPEAARAEQRRLAAQVTHGPARVMPPVACGVDVSYPVGDGSAVAVAVTIDTASLETVEVARAVGRPAFPYEPGLLSFRELPLVVEALAGLGTVPNLVVADGHGYAHPARLGMASHLGVITGIPTIGCAKTMFVGHHGQLGPERGAQVDIVDDDEVVGSALRTQTNVKPVYVSVGHQIDLPSARAIVLALASRYRLPETTRRADQLSRQYLADEAGS